MRLQQRFGTKFSVLVLEKCRLKLLNGFWENDRCDMPKTCLITRLLSLRWWKHIWVAVHPHTIENLSFISQLVSMEEGKETKGKLTTEPKIQRTSEEERDRLILLGWLQVFTNVKILTLSYGTLKLILKNPSLLVLPITIEAKLDQAWSGITIINTIREAYDLHVMGILCDAY
ncbi:uncharacterized protein [Glycine max]|uniref:uncharacterized protein isoform X8 n=1 Tax=Glycine max TaxID=3847 RepID=UPI001B354E87|nr:uncharacterized protein LOC100811594 isoform X8 [Glycine max]